VSKHTRVRMFLCMYIYLSLRGPMTPLEQLRKERSEVSWRYLRDCLKLILEVSCQIFASKSFYGINEKIQNIKAPMCLPLASVIKWQVIWSIVLIKVGKGPFSSGSLQPIVKDSVKKAKNFCYVKTVPSASWMKWLWNEYFFHIVN